MRQAEFEHHVGAANICPSVEAALERARTLYAAIVGDHASNKSPTPSTAAVALP
jgi:hypothetical protein